MLNTNAEAITRSKHRRSEANEVRFLVAILFVWFFVAAACKRVFSLFGSRPAGSRRPSCFEEAKRSAYSVVPYVLMQ